MSNISNPCNHEYIIIICGNEILQGRRQDRHIRFLARELSSIGLICDGCHIVGDSEEYLAKTIKNALDEVPLVIVTGGLGPTMDDITREAISKATNIPMTENHEALMMLEDRFRSLGRKMSENNRRQALVPANGTFFPNPYGTAPGLVYDYQNKFVLALPGPPRELEPMVKKSVVPFLQDQLNVHPCIAKKSLHFCCIGESNIDDIIRKKIGAVEDLEISSLSHLGTVQLTLSLPNDSRESINRLQEYSQLITDEIGDYVYSEKGETLEETVCALLRQKNMTLSVAESCTGGMLGEKITSVPGSSSLFLGGIISYSNEIKEKLLGVNHDTLSSFGAVSPETAREMAIGMIDTFKSDWSLSITGIAGPDGGTHEKPVGTVWIAIADSSRNVHSFKINAIGGRKSVRERSCIYALDQLRRNLLELPLHQ